MSNCCDAGRCVYHTLFDENEALKKQNKEIKEENETLKFHEKQLRDPVASLYKKIRELKSESAQSEAAEELIRCLLCNELCDAMPDQTEEGCVDVNGQDCFAEDMDITLISHEMLVAAMTQYYSPE